MTISEYSPLLRNGSSRSSTTQHHLPINAHYYDITDIESWPIAGLLVLLDGQQQPVRAELHLYDGLEGHVQDAAIRQARLVLQERYLGADPVPVRILETLQVREEMSVRLSPLGARPTSASSFSWARWRPHGIAAAALLLVVALIWVITSLVSAGRGADNGAVVSTTPDATTEAVAGAQEGASADAEQGEALQTEALSVASGNDPANDAGTSNGGGEELPTSRNARGDLGIGVRVQVVPGLQLALRSEPGVDSGLVVGAMREEDIATIIGGPEYRAGDADTIVWWYLEFDNGTQAWAAANTSDQTLLMPVQ